MTARWAPDAERAPPNNPNGVNTVTVFSRTPAGGCGTPPQPRGYRVCL